MKKLLVPALLFLSTQGFAQENKTAYKSFYELAKSKPTPGKVNFTIPLTNNHSQVNISKAKQIILPLDNMPCLVPDVSGFNMPVFKPGGGGFNMPVVIPGLPAPTKVK